MEFERRDEVTPDEYIEMIRLKTAVLIAAGCQIGAWIGGKAMKTPETFTISGTISAWRFS